MGVEAALAPAAPARPSARPRLFGEAEALMGVEADLAPAVPARPRVFGGAKAPRVGAGTAAAPAETFAANGETEDEFPIIWLNMAEAIEANPTFFNPTFFMGTGRG